ncbi:adenosine deaminase [Actinopolymorpha sp. B9G3]|uniref:adenosine deaminase n=1 Tax=Actinopolymorpha sp. B9G3 TaxID=3158970 RepID=UPI0032D9252E
MGDTSARAHRAPVHRPDGAGRDLTSLPKAHLHLHLAGAMRPATLRELAARYGVPAPAHDGRGVKDWAEFQQLYDAARAVIRTPDDIGRVVAEAAADDAADGCGWLELQVDPTSYAETMGGVRAALEAVLTAAASAPIPVGVMVASSWARSPDHAERLARLAAAYADAGVVAFGLSNDERHGEVAAFVPAFRLVADAGLLASPHSGFYTAAPHVRDCVHLLDAARIGHGTSAVGDPETLALLAERRVTLEVCPTSYPPFGVHALDEVPVQRLLAADVPVALGSDDPLLFGVGLAGQYAICRDLLGLSDDQLATLAGHSIEGSAAPPEVKRDLRTRLDDWRRPERFQGPAR